MIKFCDNKEEIIPLWAEVFGDSEDEIAFFIDNVQHGKCLGYYDDEKLVSMFYLIDCSINCKKCGYIYAACTSKESEGRGYMTSLISYAAQNFENSLCLIPASESLIDFYQKRGFNSSARIDELCFNEIDEIKEYLFEGYELKNPLVMIKE